MVNICFVREFICENQNIKINKYSSSLHLCFYSIVMYGQCMGVLYLLHYMSSEAQEETVYLHILTKTLIARTHNERLYVNTQAKH